MLFSEMTSLTKEQQDEIMAAVGSDYDGGDYPLSYEEALGVVEMVLYNRSKANPNAKNPRWVDEPISFTIIGQDGAEIP